MPKRDVDKEEEGKGVVYAYEVFPVNFIMLSDAKQDEVVDGFRRFLNSLSKELRIHVVKTNKTIDLGGEPFETTYYRFFIESHGAAVDHPLNAVGLRYQRITEVPAVEPVKVFGKWMAMPGGQQLRTYTIYGLPGNLVEGFICEVYGAVEQIVLCVRPLPPEEATMRMGKYMRLLRSVMLADQSKGKTVREDVALRWRMAEEAFHNLVAGATRLFELKVNVSVAGGDRRELNRNVRRLREILQSRLVRLDSPAHLQLEMARGLEGKRLVVDTNTAACFFPFMSGDMIESPGGVFLGVNRLTGAPVIYDPSLRMNQNILIVGKSGSGKSFLNKILLTRLAQQNKNLALFVIDPENEYGGVGRLLGAQVVDVHPDRMLGLDPVQIFADSKDSAAAIVADIAKVPAGALHSTLRTVVGRSESIFDAYERSPPDLKDYLESLVDGADRFLVVGEPIQFTRRMVFNLSRLHQEFQLSPERSVTLQAASILLFSKVWQLLDNPEFLPIQDPKLVTVDEVWLYTAMPASARFLEGVSRRGRKRNCIFSLMTQRVSDVLEGAGGRALVENCVTKVVLRQDESAINLVGETFGLSDAEKETALDFAPGQGILIAENVHIPVDFLAGKEEHAIFTTRPAERLVF